MYGTEVMAMRQISYLCNSKSEFIDKVADFKKKYIVAKGMTKSVLATVFVSTEIHQVIPSIIEILKNEIPEIKIIGGTVAANITKGYIETKGVSLTFTTFKESMVDVIPIKWDDDNSRNLGKAFLRYLWDVPNPVAVQLVSSGYNLNVVPFFKEVSNCPDDIVFFGGIIDDGTLGDGGCVFSSDTIMERGMIAVVYQGSKLQVLEGTSCGWRPLGRRMTVTEMEGSCVIREIDYMPVRDVYGKYLGSDLEQDFINETISFPFCFKRNGFWLYRLPREMYADGSVGYGADFKLGENVQFAYGDPSTIIREANDMQNDLVRFKPDAIFAVSCWSRKQLLHKNINQELQLVRKNATSCGVYAFGEYIRVHRDIYCANMTLCVVAMREGSYQANRVGTLAASPLKLQGDTLILHRMIHLIEAVSSELEATNKQLSYIAHIDSLTGLLNRGELEAVLKKSLDYARVVDKPISVVMLDVDYFKVINDTYGHDVGDLALKKVADILKNNIQDVDAAGRWGGDEFFVVLSGKDKLAAIKFAEKIRCQILNAIFDDYEALHITSSLGVAQADDDDTIRTLFNKADKALYIAKSGLGRNAVASV